MRVVKATGWVLALTKYNVIWISCFSFMGHVYARDMYISFIMQLNNRKCLSWCYVNIVLLDLYHITYMSSVVNLKSLTLKCLASPCMWPYRILLSPEVTWHIMLRPGDSEITWVPFIWPPVSVLALVIRSWSDLCARPTAPLTLSMKAWCCIIKYYPRK